MSIDDDYDPNQVADPMPHEVNVWTDGGLVWARNSEIGCGTVAFTTITEEGLEPRSWEILSNIQPSFSLQFKLFELNFEVLF